MVKIRGTDILCRRSAPSWKSNERAAGGRLGSPGKGSQQLRPLYLALIHPSARKWNSAKLGSLYSWESAVSSSSTIFRPSIISKVKRTMPLSLPLCSK